MNRSTRRRFLADIGRGALAASIGVEAAFELGLSSRCFAADSAPDAEKTALSFGPLEPTVRLMQETPIEKLLGVLVEKIRAGVDLRELTAAAALANARTFGGEDYVGFHTLMALAPAYRMAREMPPERRALPILKVLYRNTNRIQEKGGRASEVLEPVEPLPLEEGREGGELLRDAVRAKQLDKAEAIFRALVRDEPAEAFDDLLYMVEDATEVHRVVLPYRAWDLLDIVGAENAHTLLRQSVRYCARSEAQGLGERYTASRSLLPLLFERHKLLDRGPGTRPADDGWVERMSRVIFESTPSEAADAAALALAEGIAPDAIGEAISLATNQLVLRDHGRREHEVQPGKPLGSVHGDSIGVHASDSANAWRNMARVSGRRNKFACLILGAYQAALDRVNRGGDFLDWDAFPTPEQLASVESKRAEDLLRGAEEAIRANDQMRACAIVKRYGELELPERPVFDLLLRFATSEDGALHGEKYYGTVSEEFRAARPAFRWRQLVSLARVTASEFGRPAPGYEEACSRLGVS